MARRGHKEGGITKRYNRAGKFVGYQVQVRIPGGKRVTVGTVATMAEARQLAQQGLVALNQGRLTPSPRQTVGEYLAAWVDSVRPSIRPKTVVAYDLCARRVSTYIGNIRLDRLEPAHLQQCYTDLLSRGVSGRPLAARSVEQTHTVFHSALSHAVMLDLIPRNPADLVSAPRPKQTEMKTLTPEQARQLFEATEGNWDNALWVLMITAGPRLGEALGLMWSDIDLDGRTAIVRRSIQRQTGEGLIFVEPKSSASRRTLELTQFATEALRQHRVQQLEQRLLIGPRWQDSGMVFCSEIGTAVDPANVRRRFYRLRKQLSLPPVRLHDLRHTAATLHLQQGTHPRAVQALLGHSSWNLTMNTYSHVVKGMQREAADRLDALFSPASLVVGAEMPLTPCFAYGSNMDEEQILDRCPDATPGRRRDSCWLAVPH